MAKLDKDIHQKEAAIRFCMINGLMPFLEVNVNNYRELSETSTVITDIDVLGVSVNSTGRPKRVIFDCKTLGKTSPINRAFWAAGLMQFAGCSEAFIVLRKKASQAHRLSAKQIGVHLFDERQFTNYAESCSMLFTQDYCYSSNINNWTKFYECCKGNENLSQFVTFISTELPLEADSVKGIRRFFAALQKVKGELNPENAKHCAIFYFSLTVFGFLMSQAVHDLRNLIDFDADRESFEKLLKFYIWGGRDSFILRDKLTKLFAANQRDDTLPEPELRAWPEFMELVRSLLDSPDDVLPCAFPLREISFRYLVDEDERKEKFLAELIEENKRMKQYSMAMCKYLVDAVKLPKEFQNNLGQKFNDYKLKLRAIGL